MYEDYQGKNMDFSNIYSWMKENKRKKIVDSRTERQRIKYFLIKTDSPQNQWDFIIICFRGNSFDSVTCATMQI